MTGIGVGATLVPQFARAVIDAYGWRAGYVALAALMFSVAFPVVAIFIREPDSHARTITYGDSVLPGLTLGESVRSTSFWLLALPVFLVVTAINGIVGHLVPLLTDRGFAIGQATAALSAVGLSTIAGRLVSGYLLDRFFAPYVAAVLFLLPLAGVGILAAGLGGPALILAAIALGFGLGAEVDVIGFMVSRYFGLRSYGEIYGCLFAIFTVGTGLGPVLMGLSFDETRSYRSRSPCSASRWYARASSSRGLADTTSRPPLVRGYEAAGLSEIATKAAQRLYCGQPLCGRPFTTRSAFW